MGAGIAEVSARAGVDVLVYEPTEALTTAGRIGSAVKSVVGLVSSGKITERERDAAVGKLKFTTEFGDLADRQLVIEAILEDESVKAGIFAELDRVITDPDAVLASNTSSIPIMKLAAATANPGRVLGLHFFNPVPVLPLVELVSTLVTDEAAAARTEEFASAVLRKQVVRCSDRSGFVGPTLCSVPYLLSAIRMVEAGFATVEDVDKAVVAVLSHPMGPPRLSDLVGLDTLKLIVEQDVPRVQRPAIRCATAVAAHGGGGAAREEIGQGLLPLRTEVLLTSSGARPAPELRWATQSFRVRGLLHLR